MLNFSLKNHQVFYDPTLSLKFHTVLAVGVILLFGVIGFQNSQAALVEKRAELAELTEQEKALQNTLWRIEDTEVTLTSLQNEIPLLYKAIPDSSETDVYLLELTNAFSENGYVLLSYRTMDTGSGYTKVSLSVLGEPNEIFKLFSAIESLPRKTHIKTANVPILETGQKIAVSIEIFYMEKEVLDLTRPFDDKIDTSYLKKEFKAAYE